MERRQQGSGNLGSHEGCRLAHAASRARGRNLPFRAWVYSRRSASENAMNHEPATATRTAAATPAKKVVKCRTGICSSRYVVTEKGINATSGRNHSLTNV